MIQPDSTLPIVDWEYTKSLSNKAAGLTEDLVQLFLQQLPAMQTALTTAFAEQNLTDLSDHLHKLQGSCTYCGFKRLAKFVATISHALKEHAKPDQNWLNMLNEEIELIKKELAAKNFTA